MNPTGILFFVISIVAASFIMYAMAIKPISVSELSGLINAVLTDGYDFGKVYIEGEVSGFKVSQDKWVHFDIKDGESTVPCFMTIWQLKVPLEDGMKVIIRGRPKVTAWGKFSYTVEEMRLFGEGALKRAYELLKNKLEAEGLFATERKRELPRFPARIGLITAPDSAAYHDFINTLEKRFGGLEIIFTPVQVQGKQAPEQVVSAIQYFGSSPSKVDCLAIVRGGGSLEDLQAFNDERVVRAVFASKVPVVCGVGHDVDVSLADLASDVRAKTPTDAAILIAPDRFAVAREVDYHSAHLSTYMERILRQYRLYLDRAITYLIHFGDTQNKRFYESVGHLEKHFLYFEKNVGGYQKNTERFRQALVSRFMIFFDILKNKIEYGTRTLNNLDPKKLLARGYSITTYKGRVVKSRDQIKTKDKIITVVSEGTFESKII